jgi:5-methylthioribose kinase
MLNHQHIFEIPLTPDNGLTLPEELTSTAAQFATDASLKTRAAELGDIYLKPSKQLANARLLHGDYYPGSWLRTDNRLYVIDVEFAFLGALEFDLGVFLAHCVMTGTQPEKLPALLADYPASITFDLSRALDFAAMEIIRRLLGVAQLPLAANAELKLGWLDWSREQLRT